MGNKRQRLAKRRHAEARGGGASQNREEAAVSVPRIQASLKPSFAKISKKHPLRVVGKKPGDGCFICNSNQHIAKACPQKSGKERKMICLLCRKLGHTLKNCPTKADGLEKKCYNCGESGHRLAECKEPLKDGGTAFASCFLCKESGHLSKTCPSNTHGIYPKRHKEREREIEGAAPAAAVALALAVAAIAGASSVAGRPFRRRRLQICKRKPLDVCPPTKRKLMLFDMVFFLYWRN